MTSDVSAGTQTGTRRLELTMWDSPSLQTASGFGEVFRNLDSLLFVCALQAEIERLDVGDVERSSHIITVDLPPHTVRATSRAFETIDVALPLGAHVVYTSGSRAQARSASLVDRAIIEARQIQVESVRYQSPLEIVLTLAQVADVFGGFGLFTAGVLGAGSAIFIANRAVKLWERVSDARIKHADATKASAEAKKAVASVRGSDFENDITLFEARIKAAQARQAEADARLRESEVELKLEAHNVIRDDMRMIRTIYEAGSAAPLDSSKRAEELLQHLDQASAAIASIENMQIVEV